MDDYIVEFLQALPTIQQSTIDTVSALAEYVSGLQQEADYLAESLQQSEATAEALDKRIKELESTRYDPIKVARLVVNSDDVWANKIEAIKRVREMTGMSLKQAKDACEAIVVDGDLPF